MYSLHPPSVTVNCVDCYRKNHCKLCTKFFVRFMSHINRRFTDYHRFPRSISDQPIFVVRSHNKDATRTFAIATKGGGTLRPIFIVRFVRRFLEAMQSRQRFHEVKTMPYRHRVGIHQIRTYPPIATVYVKFFFCGNMGVVFVRASLSISRISSSVRSISNMDFLNHVSRMNRS